MEDNVLNTVTIFQGEYCISDTPKIIRTVVGSCVAVIFFSEKQPFGAMIHGMLPTFHKDSSLPETMFVDVLMKIILDEIALRELKKHDLRIGLIGGANLLANPNVQRGFTVGRQNSDKAIECLQKAGLKIHYTDTGDNHGRKIFFNTKNGEITVYKINASMETGKRAQFSEAE